MDVFDPSVAPGVFTPAWGGLTAREGLRLIRGLMGMRSEEHTSELQSLMRISYAVFCLKKKKQNTELTKIMHNTYTMHNITNTLHNNKDVTQSHHRKADQ